VLTQESMTEAFEHLVSIGDFLRWGQSKLQEHQVFLGHGTDNAHDEALALMLHVLHLPWNADAAILQARLLPSEKQQFLSLLEKRINARIPAPYLTGVAWFCSLPFDVDNRVLIPRSPLGELIEAQFAPWIDAPDDNLRVLDLCTGSGCIAIATAYALPNALVDAIDISADALAVCEVNVVKHGLEERVFPLLGDGLSVAQGPYDVIVSNPPYVDAEEMASLPDEYRHEPELALASGEDGLDFTRTLLAQAAEHLSEDGILIAEVGYSWPAVVAQWPEVPFLWIEFERGGEGAFMLSRQQLLEYRHLFI